jgi:DNA (cytosine-5)-methyltransferase 1
MKVGSDFSGVGAFDQALKRLGVNYETVFACDMDKYARDTFIHNYGEPKYYPINVYDREIPTESLDIYMTSPPCQAFSLAGKRLGKDDKRGVLFFNSHEFIQINKPRFFIFENVKGLLSDDGGRTFQEWVNMLGGKSVNGLPVLFAHDDAVPYHLYWQVLNAKHHGVPQNRERVFLIGIRDDVDNHFQFPREEHLSKRLKDVLEYGVGEKYYIENISNIRRLSETLEKHELPNGIRMIDSYNKSIHEDSICISTRINASSCTHLYIPNDSIKVGDYRKDEGFRWREDGNSPCLHTQLKDIDFNEKRGQSAIYINNEYKIRRLTPRECFRLMDFPDTFTWKVSDSQAYKQAGNSIVVNVLYKILKQIPL